MEAEKTVTAQEERRRKLLEYLAAKGKLKSQNNQKPYLRDTTNLQNKRQEPLPKQVYEQKKTIPVKGKFETNKKTSTNVLLQNRLEAGKISAHQNVSHKRAANQVLPKKPALSKQNISRAKSDQDVQRKNADLKEKLGERSSPFMVKTAVNEDGRGEHPDIGITVIVSKIQHGDKTRISDVHVVDQSLSSTKGPSKTKQIKYIQTKGLINKPQMLHQSSVMMPVNKPSKMQAPKPKPAACVTKKQFPASKPVTKGLPPAGKSVPTASTGLIRIVSRVSQPASKNGTATERSFLIKSFRGNGAQQKQPQTLNLLTRSAPSSVMEQNTGSGFVSAPKIGEYSSSYASKKACDVQCHRPVSKPAVWQTSTGPVTSNKTVRPQISSTNQAKGTNSKPMLTSSTCQSTGKTTASKPHTPKMTVEDRRKKLQEWLTSKSKTYKRPPMILPPKRPTTAKKKTHLNASVWEGIEEEEELLLLSKRITQALGDCLELIGKGVSAEDIHDALDKIPEGKKFAKYWICKAKLQEREGIFDVVDLYKQGVQCGAVPINELRDVVFNIMKDTNKQSKVVTFGPLPIEDPAEEDEKDKRWHATPAKKPADDTEEMCNQGSAVKFQVACVSSKKKRTGSSQEWKCLTPVRRSLRIHHSVSQYPEVVQEHDTVVTCLDELLDMADTEEYLYVRNEALPEEADHTILGMVKHDGSEDQNERPV